MNQDLSPEAIQADIDQRASEPAPAAPDVNSVLNRLLDEITRVDFKAEAFPEAVEADQKLNKLLARCTNADGSMNDEMYKQHAGQIKAYQEQAKAPKLRQQHYLIISVDKLLKLALGKRWGLCQRLGFHYVYNGELWQQIEPDLLKSFLGAAAQKMGVPRFDSKYFDFKDKMMKQFESEAYLPAPDPDPDTILINLKNGTLQISRDQQQLRPFNRDDFLTYQLPFDYDPAAEAPLFNKYLHEVLPDPESRGVLAEFCGYIFTRNMKLDKVLFLYGSGQNGKSVFFEVLRALLGKQNITHYTLGSLTDENGYYRAKIVDSLLNYASDIGRNMKTDKFKTMVSGEPVEARLPRKDPIMIENVCKFAFNTNELPADVEHNEGFFRRFLIIPFDQYIRPDQKDTELPAKIIANELPGVLNWILAGLNRLIAQKDFSRCRASDKALADYRIQSDSVSLFLDDRDSEPDPLADNENKLKARPLYNAYKVYCADEGLKFVAYKTFQSRLKGLGYIVKRLSEGKVLYAKRKADQDRGDS